jgi:MFS family permease
MPKISMKELIGLPTRFREEFRQTFRSLSNPYVRLYSIGQLVSNAGTWMQSMALSWLVYKLTDSAVALGIVSFASYVPLLFLTYFGGILADRFDRRKILMATQLCGMLQALVLTVLVATGNLSVPAVIGCALFLGCVTAIEVPTRQSFLSDLVAKKDLTNAISVNSAIFNISRLSGPLLAGVLIAAFGEVICFGINTVSYVFAVYTLSQVAKAVVSGAKPKTTSATNSAKLKVALQDPRIRGLLALAVVTSMFGFQYGVLLPVIAWWRRATEHSFGFRRHRCSRGRLAIGSPKQRHRIAQGHRCCCFVSRTFCEHHRFLSVSGTVSGGGGLRWLVCQHSVLWWQFVAATAGTGPNQRPNDGHLFDVPARLHTFCRVDGWLDC